MFGFPISRREGDECLASGWQFDVCEMWFDKAGDIKGKYCGEMW